MSERRCQNCVQCEVQSPVLSAMHRNTQERALQSAEFADLSRSVLIKIDLMQ